MPTCRKFRPESFALAVALVALVSLAEAGEPREIVPCATFGLIPNAGFNSESDLGLWDNAGAATWSSKDADGSPTSGSVEITVDAVTSTSIGYCVPVTGGKRYKLGVDILIATKGQLGGQAGIVARWQADENCTDPLNDFPANTSASAALEWKSQQQDVMSPAAARGALLELRVSKTSGTGGSSITGNLDNPFFALLGSPDCGDPLCSFTGPSSSDALYTLRTSVGSAACPLCYCDVNDSGAVTAGDALLVLRAAVKIPEMLACPACE